MSRSRSVWRCILPPLCAAFVCALPALAQEPPKPHAPVPFDTAVAHHVVPGLRHWEGAGGDLLIGAASRIVISAAADARTREIARQLAMGMRDVSGLALPVVTGHPMAGDIALDPRAQPKQTASTEGYTLAVGDHATVAAGGSAGLFYGTRSLLQLLQYDTERRALPRGQGADWPDYPRRAVMIDAGRRFFQVAQLEDLMRQMAWLKLNTLGLHFTDWPAFRLNSDKFPGLAARQSYDRADIARLEATAKRYGITIIPEIDLPAHASAMIRYRPSLAFRCESMRQSAWLTRSAGVDAKNLAWTIDITRAENRDWIKTLLDEFIPWFSGPYFHIGGDEYQYDADKTRCPELKAYAKARGFAYPGDVFVDWINQTDKIVRAHGKQTVIWNWWRFKDDKTSIQPNRDILIYAWNAPRLDDIIANGYQVIVSPEDELYVVPGIENFDGSGYGVVDTDHVYGDMELRKGPQVSGYMLALWADAAEHRTDTYLLARAYEPMAVLAERLWSGRSSASLDAFLARLNAAGGAPQPGPSAP